MEESFKNRLIIILAVLTLIFFMSTVSSCGNASRQKNARQKEMATRLDLEEKMNKFGQEKANYDAKINSLNHDLEAQKVLLDSTKKSLLQEQLINQSIKEELQKVTKLKEALEEDLKDVLIRNKTAKPKK